MAVDDGGARVSVLINAAAAAEKLGWTRAGLYKLVARKGLPHIRIDGVLRFDPADLDRWIEVQKTKAHRCPTCAQSILRLRRVG